MHMRTRGLVLGCLLALGGCSLTPPQAQQPKYHDFGPPEAPFQQVGADLGLREVITSVWLDNSEIHYRLLYDDPTQLRAYAKNRWVAPPTDLLQHDMRKRMSPEGKPAFWLEVHLTRFEQDFDKPNQSHVVFKATALLIYASDGLVAKRKHFDYSTDSAPTVDGAVTGLSALAKRASRNMVVWATRNTTPRNTPP